MDRLLLLIFSLLISLNYAQENKWAIFSWGGIKQSKEDQFCTFTKYLSNEKTQIQKWKDKEQYCQAWRWDSPSDAKVNASCGITAPPSDWPPKFTLVNGSALDGDFWNETSHCHSSPNISAECVKNICVLSSEVGSYCRDSKDCTKENYCTGLKACAPLAIDGEKCEKTTDCVENAACVNLEGKESPQWVLFGSLEDGALYTEVDKKPKEDPLLHFDSLCQSTFAMHLKDIDKMQCRKPFRNADQNGIDGLAREAAGEEWEIIIYIDPKPEKYDKEMRIPAPYVSMWGFNKDDRAYCPIENGDDFVNNVVDKIVLERQNILWHRESGKRSHGSYCQFRKSIVDSKLLFSFEQILKMLAHPQVSVNGMNNDKCVAETIMADFWQGNFNTAESLKVLGLFASIIIINIL